MKSFIPALIAATFVAGCASTPLPRPTSSGESTWNIKNTTKLVGPGSFVAFLDKHDGKWSVSRMEMLRRHELIKRNKGHEVVVFDNDRNIYLVETSSVERGRDSFACFAGILGMGDKGICQSEFVRFDSGGMPASIFTGIFTIFIGSIPYMVKVDTQKLSDALSQAGFFTRAEFALDGLNFKLQVAQQEGRNKLQNEIYQKRAQQRAWEANDMTGQLICYKFGSYSFGRVVEDHGVGLIVDPIPWESGGVIRTRKMRDTIEHRHLVDCSKLGSPTPARYGVRQTR